MVNREDSDVKSGLKGWLLCHSGCNRGVKKLETNPGYRES